MISEKVLGTLKDEAFKNKQVDYVDIEWYEAFKKLHRKKTMTGSEIGIRLGNEILTKGLNQDDVLAMEGETVIAVNIPPCKVIAVTTDHHHLHMLIKAAYEIGNKHAAAFWGISDNQIITPYTEPLYELLSKLHGVTVEAREETLIFSRSISSSINNHNHD